MIKNNLAKLLAERNIKASRLSLDTGIAQSTLSRISNNATEKIEYSTINTLCKYLGVEPKDFFEFVPVDLEFDIYTELFDIKIDTENKMDNSNHYGILDIVFNFDFYIKAIGRTESVTYNLDGMFESMSSNTFKLKVNFSSEDETKNYFDMYRNDIPFGFYQIIVEDITTMIGKEFWKNFNQWFDNEIMKEYIVMDVMNILEHMKEVVSADYTVYVVSDSELLLPF